MGAQSVAPGIGGNQNPGRHSKDGNGPSLTPRKLRGDHCLCQAYGEYFNSTRSFDRHRAGPHGWGTRRCLTVAEMLAAGMALNAGGWWVTRQNPRRYSPRDTLAVIGSRP